MLVIEALNDLAKCSFTNDFDKLVSVSNMITLLNSVIPLFIVETIIYKSLEFCRLDFFVILAEIVKIFIFFNFCMFKCGQKVIENLLIWLRSWNVNGKFELLDCWNGANFVADCKFISFRCLRNYWVYPGHEIPSCCFGSIFDFCCFLSLAALWLWQIVGALAILLVVLLILKFKIWSIRWWLFGPTCLLLFLQNMAHLVLGIFLDEENLLFLLLVLLSIGVMLDEHGWVYMTYRIIVCLSWTTFIILLKPDALLGVLKLLLSDGISSLWAWNLVLCVSYLLALILGERSISIFHLRVMWLCSNQGELILILDWVLAALTRPIYHLRVIIISLCIHLNSHILLEHRLLDRFISL